MCYMAHMSLLLSRIDYVGREEVPSTIEPEAAVWKHSLCSGSGSDNGRGFGFLPPIRSQRLIDPLSK